MTRRDTPLFRSQQQARTCAVCVDRVADRMDTLEPGGVEFPMCSVCATQAVRDPAVQVTLRRPPRNRGGR